jgi:hypothetical protein
MDNKLQAEKDIISAADCLVRELMRCNNQLNILEQILCDAVNKYNQIKKNSTTNALIKLPSPAHVPTDLYEMIKNK